eukprot:COSAG06_NODE_829_length_12043_cov_8.656983_15_plen_75_part_00
MPALCHNTRLFTVPCLLNITSTIARYGTRTHASLQTLLRLIVRLFFSHSYIKMFILPRQARDKHRANSKQDGLN